MGGSIFSGTGVALITPFNDDYSIDYLQLNAIVERLIQGGINYIVALGTTAETPALSLNERKKILQTVIETVQNRVPVVVGIGGNNVGEIEEQIKTFDLSKVSAILSVTPYYNRPSQEGLIAYYTHLASLTHLPVILYNVPLRTGVNLLPETTLQIAKQIPNVIGIKEASGNIVQIMHIIAYKPKDFLVISGDDAITFPLLACGADGVISVIANAFPKQFSNMVQLMLKGEIQAAKEIHYQLHDVFAVSVQSGTPAGAKAFLAAQGLIKEFLRLPLMPVEDSLRTQIKELVIKMK